MKQIFFKLAIMFFILSVCSTAHSADGPRCTRDKMWKYVVNNAYRVADDYATARNPRSTFFSMKPNYKFYKQFGGEFKGKYLLMITNEHGGNTSFGVLLPLFDVNKPSEDLEEDLNEYKPVWKVVSAKLNGRPY